MAPLNTTKKNTLSHFIVIWKVEMIQMIDYTAVTQMLMTIMDPSKTHQSDQTKRAIPTITTV